jgi:hypothetical protein
MGARTLWSDTETRVDLLGYGDLVDALELVLAPKRDRDMNATRQRLCS